MADDTNNTTGADDAKDAKSEPKSKVIKAPNSEAAQMAFATEDEAKAQAKAIGKGHTVQAHGVAFLVVAPVEQG